MGGVNMTDRKSHLFVLDPLERLNWAWDTSIKIAFALQDLKHDVYFCTGRELTRSLHPSGAFALSRRLIFGSKHSEIAVSEPVRKNLDDFSAIHMRREPPYDLDYISTLWILDAISQHVPVLNSPKALLEINEKLSILDFPLFTKPAMVSSNADELLAFTREKCNANIVIKPLGLYGGRGVEHIEGDRGLEEKLHLATMNGKEARLVQEFNPAVHDGEVRAFTVAGKPVSWCLKVPKKGEFLANTRAGSTLETYRPSSRDMDVATGVAETLMRRGVIFAGIDMIGGWLSEVNITCPAMLSPDRASMKGFDLIANAIEDLASD
jgi:glutathione synthase